MDDVQHRAQPPGLELGDERAGVDHAAAAGVQQQGTVAHASQQRGVDQPPRFGGERCKHHDGVRLLDEEGQLLGGMNAVTGMAGDTDHRHAERPKRRLTARPIEPNPTISTVAPCSSRGLASDQRRVRAAVNWP